MSRDDPGKSTSDAYSKEMQGQMGSTLVYCHEAGMNYNRPAGWRLFVGSCPQTPSDVEKLHSEGVRVIFCLQEQKDHEHFNLDISAIQKRAQELGIAHVWNPIQDFSPVSLRERLPSAVKRLCQAMDGLREDEYVYIHCTAGLGRAPGVALAYMFWIEGLGLEDAYGSLFAVRRCHPQLGMIRAATFDVLAGAELALVPVRIAISRAGASVVQVAGLDVGWGKRLLLEKDEASGQFVLNHRLQVGSYQYKFIADGEWFACESLPTVVDNGNVNNVFQAEMEPGSPGRELYSRITAEGGRPTAAELARLRESFRGAGAE